MANRNNKIKASAPEISENVLWCDFVCCSPEYRPHLLPVLEAFQGGRGEERDEEIEVGENGLEEEGSSIIFYFLFILIVCVSAVWLNFDE